VSDIINEDHLFSDTYNTFDIRAGLFYENYEVAFYVDNVTNNDAVTSRYNTGVDLDSWTTFRAFRLVPRTMGLTFRVDF
jgi:outer membrane receptor protein involved in Fe transport